MNAKADKQEKNCNNCEKKLNCNLHTDFIIWCLNWKPQEIGDNVQTLSYDFVQNEI